VGEVAVVVEQDGFDDILVEIEGSEWHNLNTPMWESGPRLYRCKDRHSGEPPN
jgi:hypothetical protein